MTECIYISVSGNTNWQLSIECNRHKCFSNLKVENTERQRSTFLHKLFCPERQLNIWSHKTIDSNFCTICLYKSGRKDKMHVFHPHVYKWSCFFRFGFSCKCGNSGYQGLICSLPTNPRSCHQVCPLYQFFLHVWFPFSFSTWYLWFSGCSQGVTRCSDDRPWWGWPNSSCYAGLSSRGGRWGGQKNISQILTNIIYAGEVVTEVEHDLEEETKVDGQFKKIIKKKTRWTGSRRLDPSLSGSPTMLLKRWQ